MAMTDRGCQYELKEVNMELQEFAKVDETGALALDNDGFEKSLSSYVDSAVLKAVESARKNWEKKANDAKLSEAEKFAKEKEEFNLYMQTEKANINKEKARAKLTGKSFTEEEIDTILGGITDNADSLKTVDIFVAQRDKVLADYKQKIIEEMQTKKASETPVAQSVPTEHKSTGGLSRQEILNKYKK